MRSPRVLALIIDYYDTANAAQLSLQVAGFKDATVVHVDNGLKTPVELTAGQQAAGVKLLRMPKNLGYAGALNEAIRRLSNHSDHYDAYWLLNSDLRIEDECLPRLMSMLFSNQKTGAVGPVVKWDVPPYRTWGARGVVSPWIGTTAMAGWSDEEPLPRWSYIPGCSLLVKAEAFEEAGGLPSLYKLYYEETHLCVQLQKRGWDLRVDGGAVAYHKVNSLKAGVPARHFAYYFARNNLKFWKLCFGIPAWIQLPRALLVMGKEVVLPLRKSRSAGEAMDRFKYLMAGLIDGVLFERGSPCRYEAKLFHDLA